jgi:hypothetical protein
MMVSMAWLVTKRPWSGTIKSGNRTEISFWHLRIVRHIKITGTQATSYAADIQDHSHLKFLERSCYFVYKPKSDNQHKTQPIYLQHKEMHMRVPTMTDTI